jgi:VCBS repeat-containing protein
MIHKLIFALTLALILGLLTGVGLAGWPRPVNATNIIANVPSLSAAFQGGSPLAINDTATTSEDTSLTITVLSNDTPTGTLSIAAIGAAQHGATAISSATAVYTPAWNFAGTDSFTYTASDGALTSTARVMVTVTPSNDAPIVGVSKALYDGALGGTPDNQGFLFVPFGVASNTETGGITTLDTTSGGNSTKAGYWGISPFVPILNRANGFTLRFTAQVINETHTGSDRNGDGLDDRAGFSVIALSSDKRGIELGFWTNRIWAQNGGASIPMTGTLFTQGEGTAFNTTTALILYELRVLGGAYSLAVSNTEILSGSLRDYSAFSGPIDPYETPNFIFLGDNTTSARATMRLSYISVITNASLPDHTVANSSPLVIDKLGLLDVDAGGNNVVVIMTVNSGVLTLTTTAPGGLTTGQISGNGTNAIVATGPLGQINTTLAFTPALIYRSNAGFSGLDPASVTINDQGHTGGGALTNQKSFNINVLADLTNSTFLPVIIKSD